MPPRLCWLIVLWVVAVPSHPHRYPQEAALYATVTGSVTPEVRPRLNSSHTVDVYVRVKHITVEELDVARNSLRLQLWMMMLWKDELVTWNETEHGGVKFLRVPKSKLWTPAITIQNMKGASAAQYISTASKLIVTSYGLVREDVEIQTTTQCGSTISKFPFDVHACVVEFASDIGYSTLELNISQFSFDDQIEIVSSQWNVIDHRLYWDKAVEKSTHLSYVKVVLTLKREPIFFILSLILPLFIISTLNPLVFLVTTKSGEKLSLSVTLFLSLMFFISLLGGMLPQASDTTSLVSLYVCLHLHLSSLHVLSCILVQRVSLMTEHNWVTGRLDELLVKRPKIHAEDVKKVNDVVDFTGDGVAHIPDRGNDPSDLVRLGTVLDKFCFRLFFPLSLLTTLGMCIFIAT